MFDVPLLEAKIQVFEFDHQQMNTFEFVGYSKNDVQVHLMVDKIVLDPSLPVRTCLQKSNLLILFGKFPLTSFNIMSLQQCKSSNVYPPQGTSIIEHHRRTRNVNTSYEVTIFSMNPISAFICCYGKLSNKLNNTAKKFFRIPDYIVFHTRKKVNFALCTMTFLYHQSWRKRKMALLFAICILHTQYGNCIFNSIFKEIGDSCIRNHSSCYAWK